MFKKAILALTAAAVAVSVTANPLPSTQGTCNTGHIQCCEKLYPTGSREAGLLGSLLGINLGNLLGDIGSGCSPISVIGIGGGNKCTAAPVCCTDNKFSAY
ncbi:CoH1 [Coprinopsis cinerea AmutBmut pab1-1]|nr:CoH1 [Coprinopsis cinerea AmutBmut pab1-1]